ncbi:glutamine synthetase family protein [Candidatus Deianiraea vastatrix]|uniref:Glutamine synthetase n=1 Tax=Candidatus Deianiraea vastatrix TaxID=2163644 RepID=A0A5B8XJ76_9RICK|nr:glutamine synthetase family protein [Candidatus Deianiraea vastatrix]QED23657.1 Glutamine synthetase [Candidatus Deianiraea vastatrix]
MLNSLEQKVFLDLSYEELEARNLELKAERKEGKTQDYFAQKVLKILKDEKKIKAVMLCFTDIEGKLLNLDYDKTFFINSHDNLTFDGSSVRGFSTQDKSDLRLQVDFSSLRFLPSCVFGPGKVMMFASAFTQDGKPYESDFRQKLHSLCDDLYAKDKTIVNVAPEIEGFLLDGIDSEQNFEALGKFELVTTGGYFNSLPQDKLRKFIDAVAEIKRCMGFENEKDHPEVAPSQFELNYKYTKALEAADQIQIYKLICRQVAKLMGCTASFLPKPVMNINGSGMHMNISLETAGRNIFFEKGSEISESGKKFATSILYYAKDLCLILNSSVNAYRRLDPKFEAPNEIKISSSDRSAMIRIPIGNEKSSRIEIRSVAPDCNPYLMIFAVVSIGVSKQDDKEMSKILNKREKLPGNIYDALRYFKASGTLKAILGDVSCEKFAEIKEMAANRCPKDLGCKVKVSEIIYHHEVTNQVLWYNF